MNWLEVFFYSTALATTVGVGVFGGIFIVFLGAKNGFFRLTVLKICRAALLAGLAFAWISLTFLILTLQNFRWSVTGLSLPLMVLVAVAWERVNWKFIA